MVGALVMVGRVINRTNQLSRWLAAKIRSSHRYLSWVECLMVRLHIRFRIELGSLSEHNYFVLLANWQA